MILRPILSMGCDFDRRFHLLAKTHDLQAVDGPGARNINKAIQRPLQRHCTSYGWRCSALAVVLFFRRRCAAALLSIIAAAAAAIMLQLQSSNNAREKLNRLSSPLGSGAQGIEVESCHHRRETSRRALPRSSVDAGWTCTRSCSSVFGDWRPGVCHGVVF